MMLGTKTYPFIRRQITGRVRCNSRRI
ncbi:hypothetical protein Pint_29116 [Pistacia integerrima]|uniref:Uncharacterized protein n=1 Tax=Pistacia integerrima TaxID=434235 RepID=A0ACC0X2Y4_9ROSI|nr:hypothetical protein Pint_29116 [Pistacia integerrima]